jgi:hypothetical protein
MKPKLTLRDLFWLVLVCTMGLGWWLDRSHQAALAERWYWRWESESYQKTDLLRYYYDPEA